MRTVPPCCLDGQHFWPAATIHTVQIHADWCCRLRRCNTSQEHKSDFHPDWTVKGLFWPLIRHMIMFENPGHHVQTTRLWPLSVWVTVVETEAVCCWASPASNKTKANSVTRSATPNPSGLGIVMLIRRLANHLALGSGQPGGKRGVGGGGGRSILWNPASARETSAVPLDIRLHMKLDQGVRQTTSPIPDLDTRSSHQCHWLCVAASADTCHRTLTASWSWPKRLCRNSQQTFRSKSSHFKVSNWTMLTA